MKTDVRVGTFAHLVLLAKYYYTHYLIVNIEIIKKKKDVHLSVIQTFSVDLTE